MIHLIAFAIFVCSACTALAGVQEFGHPLFRTFTARNYGEIGQILAVTEDAQGRMLFGCRNAIVAFDNNQWETIPVPGVGYIRSLAVDRRGLVWFRSNEQIGYLTRVGDQYRAVKAYSGSFGPNSRIAVAGNQVYFSTETGLVIWNNGHIYQQPWPTNSFLPFSLALSHGKIRVGDRDGYIYEFEGNRFNRVAESPPTDAGLIRTIVDCPIGDGLIVRRSGIFQKTGPTAVPWETDIDSFLQSSKIFDAKWVLGKYLAVLVHCYIDC
jgi:hypothetical protein